MNNMLTHKEYKQFWLGRVVKRHVIGGYEIVEYLTRKTDGCTITMELTDVHEFSVESQRESYPTLDHALLGCICHKYGEGKSTYLIAKMLGIKTENQK